ncbi:MULTISPECIES: DUF3024 domain-containing protein [Vibrio]|uniref:DUF3024 domain-containing protein n=1 Tax=Vibrio proteolyticus NBRC 13287 TaxID=1219065 RepID=U2ZH51_VIBPR|nr:MULTISPECIES: DUF3024 domain-containing protein [Vibrio]NAW58836.1 DUF3024 domain-containing protein [Vibrio sp. V36_P2S2PM302]NAX20491.1 DUF3024 domain-containing protein [Vibrio sp. V39_P1S14PM300]NAX26477.1 DUF3024 domain-containing protein [Vibrio sp. V38_P2S17PM301]NAX31357.1 DUF3024 domain-containing protein [Vibrio sp. V37_P2S8PM304]GAD67016.1 hypothetical protein VPR01S_06_00330 [Vibrio proteolyticus NBRC 13287]
MSLVNLLQRQVETRAQVVCQNRNQSLPVELGKASFEVLDNGVVFVKQHYLLDSSHCDYFNPVARVLWDEEQQRWNLSVIQEEGCDDWVPYPYLAFSNDLTALMREIEKDPKSLFWD